MKIEKSRKAPLAFALGVGAVLTYLTRKLPFFDFSDPGIQSAKLLGLGCLSVGILAILLDARHFVEADKRSKKVRLVRSTRFGKRVKEIAFEQILSVDLWKETDDQTTFHIFLRFQDGVHLRTGLSWFREETATPFARDLARCVGCEFNRP